MKNIIVCLIGVLAISHICVVYAGNAPLTLFNQQEVATYGARCLDGTPSGYYLYKTSNAAYKNHWAIFLEGGGWCFPDSTYPNVDNCYNRAKTTLGSSNGRSSSMNIGFFRDHNYVFIFYCGGDFHSGQRTSSVGGLYYAGHNTVKAAITKLKNEHGLADAVLVTITGESAGGIGTIANFDYVKSEFPNAKVMGWSNAGWFPESFVPYTSNRITMVEAYKILYAQVDAYLNKDCVAHYTSDPWLCYSGQYVYPYAKIPLFMAQSLFDDWAKGFLGVPPNFSAPATIAYWKPYGQAMRKTFEGPLAGPATTGVFLTTNDVHVVGQGEVVNGKTLNQVLSNWLDGLEPVKEVSSCTYVNCLPSKK